MSIDKLRERLDSLAHEPSADAQKRRDQWIVDVGAVLRDIEGWLRPLKERARVSVSQYPFNEPDVGAYEVGGARIELDGVPDFIDVMPAGVQLVGVRLTDGQIQTGVRGRITMSYGALKIPIVRLEDHTWAVSTFGNPKLRPLDETTFSEALVELLPQSEA